MARRTPQNRRPKLTPEQQAEAQRIQAALLETAADDIRELAELLASKDDSNTFGATEFTVRDIVHRIGAKAVQTALEGRKKGATMDPVAPARDAKKQPPSNVGDPSPS